MHAVVVRVTIEDVEAARNHLRENVVPGVSQAPGFVAGYWARKDDSGMGMVIFESEDAANAMVERVPSRCAWSKRTPDTPEIRRKALEAAGLSG